MVFLMIRLLVFVIALCAGTAVSGQEAAPAAMSPAQRQALRQIMDSDEKETKIQAESGSQKLGEIAKRIDRNLLADTPDDELHRKLSAELVDTVAGLVRTALNIKLNTARELAKVLTPEQKKLVLAELDKPGANPDLTDLIGRVFAQPKK